MADMNKLVISMSILIMVIMVSLVSASLGTYKQNDCVQIKTILNATWVNISTISYPNSSLAVSNQGMSQTGQTFTYSFCNTSNLGSYVYDYFDSNGDVYVNDFIISPTGNEKINSGEGMSIFGSVIVLVLVALFLFLLSFAFQNPAGKIIFIGLAAIVFIMAILYSLVVLTQTLGAFTDITEGFTTFWFVIKVLIGIAIIALLIFTIWISYNVWMRKRGFRD